MENNVSKVIAILKLGKNADGLVFSLLVSIGSVCKTIEKLSDIDSAVNPSEHIAVIFIKYSPLGKLVISH